MSLDKHQNRTIAGLWASYSSSVLPASAGEIQRQETRRAFYAGASGLLGIMSGIGEPDVSEDAGVAVMEGLHQEATAFAQDVIEGRA